MSSQYSCHIIAPVTRFTESFLKFSSTVSRFKFQFEFVNEKRGLFCFTPAA